MPFYNRLNTNNNFVISFSANPKNDFGYFAKGYHKAASVIANDLLQRESFSDYEAYPVVFLYRHSLELYLKSIVYKSALLCSFKGFSEIDSKLYNNHDLRFLVKKSDKILKQLFPSETDLEDILIQLHEIANEFTQIDSNSFSYRYPIDSKGNYSTKRHQVIDLKSFSASMDQILDKMSTIDFGIDIETDIKREKYENIENTLKSIID